MLSLNATANYYPSLMGGGKEVFIDVDANPSGTIVNAVQRNVASNNGDIFFRRFDDQGQALDATEITVANSANDEKIPSVGVAANGAFAIGYQDATAQDVLVNRYNAAGVFQQQISLFKDAAKAQSAVDVAMAPGGAFIAAWQETFATGDNNIHARVFDSAGNPLTSVIDVAVSNSNELQPSVDILPNGDFVVAWHDDGSDGARFRRYAADGSPKAGRRAWASCTTRWENSSRIPRWRLRRAADSSLASSASPCRATSWPSGDFTIPTAI